MRVLAVAVVLTGGALCLDACTQEDPPDDAERARNVAICESYQHNRNPFIEHPEWVGTKHHTHTCVR